MALVNKIDSNSTGLRVAEELGAIGVLTGSEVWTPYEPNSYSEFGAEIVTVARSPINANRKRKKGAKVDKNAAFGFNTDLTQTNVADLLQGFFFADLRRKGEETPTNVDGTAEEFDVAETAGFRVNDLVFAAGFDNAENNGLHVVTAVTLDTSIQVSGSDLVDDASPSGTLVVVGHQFGAGDLDVTAGSGGNFPTFTTTTKDLTELGLVPGEFIFVGGDSASLGFANSENNGFKRVKSIAANTLTIDKSDSALATEASTTETVQVFFGRVLKDETGTSIVRRTYQAERQMGAPDDASPSQIQAQYEVGCVANELTLNVETAELINADLSFIGIDEDTVDGATSLKAGTRPDLVESDAFNSSSDLKRNVLSVVSTSGDEDPTPLFAFVQNFNVTINNQASINKAVGRDGGFDISVGDFEVGGQFTAYFADITAVDSVNNVDSISYDFHLVRNNAGISVDFPLITLGDGRPNVEKDEPVLIPLENLAAVGTAVDPNYDHTLLMSFYDYLPTAADS